MIESLQGVLNFDGCQVSTFRGNGIGKIGTTGFVLGLVAGIHASAFIFSFAVVFFIQKYDVLVSIMHWSIYMTLLCTFHFLEFFITAIQQPSIVSYDSYIVNHSASYTLAAILSWIEYWVELHFLGPTKHQWILIIAGLALVLGGQLMRSMAMWTCGENFAHHIMVEKKSSHVLIKHGLYAWFRHPSYFGWFYWSIGTQILLCNPLCIIFYAYASWSFFNSRIPYEESLLINFYGDEYVEYMKHTVVGIPFIKSRSRRSE